MQQLRLVQSGRPRRLHEHPAHSGILAGLLGDIAAADREHFVVFHLDTALRVIARETVAIGTLCSTLVTPREVFKAAVINNSSAIVVAHNHPSGNLKFSRDDIACTVRLVEAGQILGIRVHDHIVVGPGLGHACLLAEKAGLFYPMPQADRASDGDPVAYLAARPRRKKTPAVQKGETP